MLAGALRTLAQQSNPLVTPAFFWKLLSLEGFHPMLDDCARCSLPGTTSRGPSGSAERDACELVAFDLQEGGMLCRACARGAGRPVSPAALDLLRRMLGGALYGVLAEPPSAAAHEVEHLGIRALEYYGDRRLRSTTLL
jgi:DNA repair protein RecO (recombination protein O)